MNTMTLDVKATTLTDKGEVRLLVSTYEKDRGGDVIQRGAWADTIRAWQASGKQIPLHNEHRADEIIGAADPATMEEQDAGLVIDAKLFLDQPKAREVWRSVKAGVISASFGYMAEDVPGPDNTRLLTKIDLIEVTLTAAPMNPGAGVLSWKGVATEPKPAPEIEAMMEFFQRDPDEVVREAKLRKGIEAEVERKNRPPLKVASFTTDF